jgi:plasmid stabilization system protein ParE
VIFFRYKADDVLEVVNILHGSRDTESYFDAD